MNSRTCFNKHFQRFIIISSILLFTIPKQGYAIIALTNIRSACSISDTLIPSIKFSKENALAIAREKGYYKADEMKSIRLDSLRSNWVIQSDKHTQSQKRHVKAHNGTCVNCRKTNGCTLVTSRTLILDANNGKVRKEIKKKTYYPNYE